MRLKYLILNSVLKFTGKKVDIGRKELERAKINSMLDKYYPAETERRALCMTENIPYIILVTMFSDKNPEKLFDFQNDAHKKIYDSYILLLEACGYIVRNSEGQLELTPAGKNFVEDITKRL